MEWQYLKGQHEVENIMEYHLMGPKEEDLMWITSLEWNMMKMVWKLPMAHYQTSPHWRTGRFNGWTNITQMINSPKKIPI